jgi:hypothetical protein
MQLVMIGAADRAEVMIVAAVAEKVRNGLLQHDRRAERIGKLESAHPFEVPSRRAPADAE